MRFIVDEASIDCDELSVDVVGDSLRRLGDVLGSLRTLDAASIGVLSGWGGMTCWRGSDLATILTSEELLERDERLRLLGLLDKCTHIDDAAEHLEPEVTVDGGPPYDSYAVALAHDGNFATGHACAVVALAHSRAGGVHAVSRGGEQTDVVFVVDVAHERLLWRAVYDVENVPEAAFFEIARRAFPDLLFAPSLSFRRLEGGYAVRSVIVDHLGALNDLWTRAYQEAGGNSEIISTRIGIGVSRESANTRAAETLMKQRDVLFRDRSYRCEWHSKLEPNRNRVHFHPAGGTLEAPLIGIFCDHLDTKG